MALGGISTNILMAPCSPAFVARSAGNARALKQVAKAEDFLRSGWWLTPNREWRHAIPLDYFSRAGSRNSNPLRSCIVVKPILR